MFYVYILYSPSKDRFYIGYSGQLKDRFLRHEQGRSKSTRAGRPWLLVYTEVFHTKSAAIRRENALKRLKSKIKLRQLADAYVANPFPLP